MFKLNDDCSTRLRAMTCQVTDKNRIENYKTKSRLPKIGYETITNQLQFLISKPDKHEIKGTSQSYMKCSSL